MTMFLTQASPYVNVEQAKSMKGNNLHLAGVIVPGTITTTVMDGSTTRFILKDDYGQTVPVVYKGPAPANTRAPPPPTSARPTAPWPLVAWAPPSLKLAICSSSARLGMRVTDRR